MYHAADGTKNICEGGRAMKDRSCKTCRYNDNLLCDRKGIWIQDNDTCSKWQQDNVVNWRETMLAKFSKVK